ncbi:STAS domain-containing protein [Candidatus Cloacimonadota bacterium]
MEIKQEKKGEVTVLNVSGRLDATTATELEASLVPLIEQNGKKIVLDLGGLEYISSAGLRILLLGMKMIKKVSGKMVICEMKEHIREIFEIAGFLPIFTIVASQDDALAQF